MTDDLKRADEWERMREEEEKRRKSLEELQRFIESGRKEGKSARDLLRIIVKIGKLKVSDASNLLSVNKNVINQWVRTLLSKGLIDVENPKLPDPTLSLSQSFGERIKQLEKKRSEKLKGKRSPEEVSELLRKKQELVEERKRGLELSEELETKNREVTEKEKELEAERQRIKELEEELGFVKKQITEQAGDEDLKKLKEQLTREHQERLKIEATLQREHEAIQKIQWDYKKEHEALLRDEEELKRKREKLKEDIEKLIEKEKELEALFDTELGAGKKEIVEKLLEEGLREMERDIKESDVEIAISEEKVEKVPKADVELEKKGPETIKEPQKIEIEEIREPEGMGVSKGEIIPEKPEERKLLIEKILEESEKAPNKEPEQVISISKEEIPKPSLELEEEKNSNSLFELVKSSRKIKLTEAIGRLDVDKESIIKWIKELESGGLIEVHSPLFGSKELVFKKDRATKKSEADLIREELRRIREEELKKK